MTIRGRTYTSDLIIFPDGRVVDSWRRGGGHRLALEDISELVTARPQVIVAGTGIYGLMRPEEDLKHSLAQHHIQLQAVRTKSAAKAFNEAIQAGLKVGGCFHLTC